MLQGGEASRCGKTATAFTVAARRRWHLLQPAVATQTARNCKLRLTAAARCTERNADLACRSGQGTRCMRPCRSLELKLELTLQGPRWLRSSLASV